MKRNYILFYILFIVFNFSQGQTTFKTMFYNLLNYPTAPPQNRDELLKNILNEYQPDIFMVCELETEDASNSILNYSLSEITKNYAQASFVSNQSNIYSSLQQNLFYNSDYFTLINQEEITTGVRDINHYTLQLNTQNNDTFLEVFVTHLKASQGSENEQARLEMVQEFTNALNQLNPDSYVIFAGDFNFYTSSESGYQQLLSSNNHVIIKDVLNTNNNLQNWHTNYSYKQIHTQATRTNNNEFDGYGAGGGLDDRFDFILFSENIVTNSQINYLNGTYKSFGNNGNCYNGNINDSSCTGEFSQTLRDNLYNMSDHLPVVATLESINTLSINSENYSADWFQLIKGNMVKNTLNFSTSRQLIGEKLIIFNHLGEKVLSTTIKNNLDKLNISSLSKGLYYIKVTNYSKTLKFVKI